MSIDIEGLRHEYKDKDEAFLEKQLAAKEPLGQFKAWFEEACNKKEILEPNAMCLASATKDGFPSARFILLKDYGKEGFKFFTNYESRKANELAQNPNVAATFYWESLNRSIRIEGHVEKVPPEESTRYFHSRPLASQIAACVSALEKEYMDQGKEIPKPDYWGGYLIIPQAVFWQGQRNRLSDRIRFRKPLLGEVPDEKLLHQGDDGWVFERLSP